VEDLLHLDICASESLRLPQGGWTWRTATLLAHSGDSWFWMIALVLIWLVERGEWHDRAALLTLAVGFQALLIFTIKQVVRRERPRGEWGQIYRAIDPHSFPSGHATRAALLACMAFGLGPLWFALALAAWAPLMALARVAAGVHYLSDILAGAIIGILMGVGMLALKDIFPALFPFLF
jgi:undecaprenyl-diphosphatase